MLAMDDPGLQRPAADGNDVELAPVQRLTERLHLEVGRLRREFRALNNLNHESILQPLGVVLDEPNSVSLLTELMPLGSLRYGY